MPARLRYAVVLAAVAVIALLLWLSRDGARRAPLARAPEALPTERPAPVDRSPKPPRAAPASRAMAGLHVPPPGADDLMPRMEHVRPKDPDGPVRDWRDFLPEERAAVSSMELDVADMGDVVERLESGEEVGRLRGRPVTADEQRALRREIDAFAAVYEDGYDRFHSNQWTIIEMSEAVRVARARFDARVREIYGLADEQFYELFPYRREK